MAHSLSAGQRLSAGDQKVYTQVANGRFRWIWNLLATYPREFAVARPLQIRLAFSDEVEAVSGCQGWFYQQTGGELDL